MDVQSICVIGVDGTGKSSIVEMLVSSLGEEKCVSQYMGMKLWETKLAKRFFAEEKRNVFYKLFRVYVVIHELRYRVYKHRAEKRIIVFDRYADEQILYKKRNQNRKNRMISLIYKFFLKDHFYQPTLVVYLFCDFACSLARKDDITSEEDISRLEQTKRLLDEYYKENAALVIDTTDIGIDEVYHRIIGKMEEMGCFNI